MSVQLEVQYTYHQHIQNIQQLYFTFNVLNLFWIMFTALRLKFGQLFKPAISITNCFHFANVMITVVT